MYTYTMQLLILNYLDSAPWWLNLSLLLCSLLYFCDLVLHILHRKWLLVRINIRTKRRNLLTLVFDAVTLMMPSFWIDSKPFILLNNNVFINYCHCIKA